MNFFRLLQILLFIALGVLSTSQLSAQGVKTIVIDPGHGGKIAPGAVVGKVMEKELALDVALRLGKLLEASHPDVKVIFTRRSDVALGESVPDDLRARTELANKAGADLFVSIHANAASNSSAYGVETLIMGESSMEQQRNENALYTNHRNELLDMSDERTAAIVRAYIQNLQFTYGQYSEALARLIQQGYGAHGRKLRPVRKQPLMVLYGVDMPAVLTEIGFMTNSDELRYMLSTKGKNELAASIHKGIADYITMVNRSQSSSRPSQSVSSSTTTTTGKATQTITVGRTPQPVSSTPTTAARPATSTTTAASKPAASTTSSANLRKGFTVQILSAGKIVDKSDYQFKIYRGKVWYYVSTGAYKYKYCYGKYSTRAEAQKELQRAKGTFPDAYVVEFDLDKK